jgi:2-polyprenyl-3-methyl-5-hydroxy-6-metoxy-1,4-benzoquinol methylase
MACNYCGSEEFDIIAKYTRFEKNNVLRCKNCSLVYLEIKAGKTDIEQFYSSQYREVPTLPVQSPEEHFHDKVTQNDANNRIQFICDNIGIKGKRVLEIGSASGSLLQKLLEHGCKEAIGVELDEKFSKYAVERGFQVFTHPIEELNLKEEFDAVVSFHTLEHVYDPKAALQAIYTALKADGCFLGEVPNQNDWRIEIFNNEVIKRFHYDPYHLFYYSPTTLTNYLKECGFKQINLETVERYNSLLQLRNLLCKGSTGKDIEETLRKYIFPDNEKDECRLPNVSDEIEVKFNRIFEKWVNSELMGNCLRWVARHGS